MTTILIVALLLLAINICLLGLIALLRSVRARRTLLCHRGRDCARLTVDDAANLPDDSGTVILCYQCGRCGTQYREEFMIEDGRVLVSTGRERL